MNLFVAMATQWRVGMSGATGLDYSALPVARSAQDPPIPDDDWPDTFDALRVLEAEALSVMNEARK